MSENKLSDFQKLFSIGCGLVGSLFILLSSNEVIGVSGLFCCNEVMKFVFDTMCCISAFNACIFIGMFGVLFY